MNYNGKTCSYPVPTICESCFVNRGVQKLADYKCMLLIPNGRVVKLCTTCFNENKHIIEMYKKSDITRSDGWTSWIKLEYMYCMYANKEN